MFRLATTAVLAVHQDGQVFVAGALWTASTTSGPIASGQTVRVVGQELAGLQVEPTGGASERTSTASSAGL